MARFVRSSAPRGGAERRSGARRRRRACEAAFGGEMRRSPPTPSTQSPNTKRAEGREEGGPPGSARQTGELARLSRRRTARLRERESG
eukprot:365391-Chlamydomonas_euryale.AAC.7